MVARLSVLVLLGVVYAGIQTPAGQTPEGTARTGALRALVQRATRLPLQATEIKPMPPRDGWAMGMVSWVA